MSVVNKAAVLSLFRSLSREGRKFTDYNFRDYARRRIGAGFRENVGLKSSEDISEQYKLGLDQLASVKRQAMVSSLYPEMISVMDQQVRA
jgi:LYR motif-containing protein 4